MRSLQGLAPGAGMKITPALAFLALISCAGGPPSPAPGTGTLWGTVELSPHEGVTPGSKERTVYADRKLRDVEFVDYGRMDFAVVYLEGKESPGGRADITLEPSLLGSPRLVPRHAALGIGGRISVKNADSRRHVVSCPRANWIHSLDPLQEALIPVDADGEWAIFVPGVPEAETMLFVSPGPFTVASRDGRWELRDLGPGPRRLRVWHPRFPPLDRPVTVLEGRASRVDLTLSVETLRREE